MEPEDLTIEALEIAYKSPARTWHSGCSQLAHVAIAVMGHGHYAYGHYLGYVDSNGHWNDRIFQRHAWVLLNDKRIVDPTRWSFENVEPYIYVGKMDDDYDEGGNQMRAAFRGPCPPAGEDRLANFKEVLASAPLFEHLTKTPFEKMTFAQAAWVANTPYDQLSFAVASIYETFIANDEDILIPIDNMRRAIREGRVKENE